MIPGLGVSWYQATVNNFVINVVGYILKTNNTLKRVYLVKNSPGIRVYSSFVPLKVRLQCLHVHDVFRLVYDCLNNDTSWVPDPAHLLCTYPRRMKFLAMDENMPRYLTSLDLGGDAHYRLKSGVLWSRPSRSRVVFQISGMKPLVKFRSSWDPRELRLSLNLQSYTTLLTRHSVENVLLWDVDDSVTPIVWM